jgi:aryl-alcohol dehydrogenase-like predicted oxidoreductase
VIVKEALANGRLTARNNAPAFREKRQLLESAAAAAGTTIDALALAAALAQPWASVVLSGAATVEHLLSNLAALQLSWADEVSGQTAALLDALVEEPQHYWKTRSNLAWN